MAKIQTNVSYAPIVKFENGYLVMENVTSGMTLDGENGTWMQELFGTDVPEEDIHFKDNTIRVKLPSCCRSMPNRLLFE